MFDVSFLMGLSVIWILACVAKDLLFRSKECHSCGIVPRPRPELTVGKKEEEKESDPRERTRYTWDEFIEDLYNPEVDTEDIFRWYRTFRPARPPKKEPKKPKEEPKVEGWDCKAGTVTWTDTSTNDITFTPTSTSTSTAPIIFYTSGTEVARMDANGHWTWVTGNSVPPKPENPA